MAQLREDTALEQRYKRIEEQLSALFAKNSDPISRMATAVALLQHKMPHFFWCGFYRIVDGELIAGPYQGPLACMTLERGKGVCWAAIQQGEALVVANVHEFPGHIACDSRSNSEVVAPLRDASGNVVGCLDVDSTEYDSFSTTDAEGLTRICAMIYA
jgi:GAF domain-containing protein